MSIAILIGSTRTGRLTPRAAKLVKTAIERRIKSPCIPVDLHDLSIPFLQERLRFQEKPHPDIVKFSDTIRACDALVVVSPEYNGSCPGVLKNALDHLTKEYDGKPVGIVTVSSGPHGGDGCYSVHSRFFTGLDAVVISKHLKINLIAESLSEEGVDIAGKYSSEVEEFIDALLTASAVRSASELDAE